MWHKSSDVQSNIPPPLNEEPCELEDSPGPSRIVVVISLQVRCSGKRTTKAKRKGGVEKVSDLLELTPSPPFSRRGGLCHWPPLGHPFPIGPRLNAHAGFPESHTRCPYQPLLQKEVKRSRVCNQSFPVAFGADGGDCIQRRLEGFALSPSLSLSLSHTLSPPSLFLVHLSLRNLGCSFDHFSLSLALES